MKRIRLYWVAFCHSYGPLSLLAILLTLYRVSATHLTLSRDFDPLVIIIWSSSESFQSCVTQILIGPHVGGCLAVSLLFGNVDYIIQLFDACLDSSQNYCPLVLWTT